MCEKEIWILKKKFTVDRQQIPPMFSALKRDGVRLYRLARQGKNIPREPRSMRVEALELKKLENDKLESDVSSPRATYFRTVAALKGNLLAWGRHLERLTSRSRGQRELKQPLTIDYLEHVA